SSEPNLSDRRRTGILFVYCAPSVRPTIDLNTALLVRGEDRHGHWKSDPFPERDLDPANVAYYNNFWASYVDPETKSEAERDAAT
ncbi:MAG: phytanoyl-CoA dioxygenase family protein, partial [Alphaproteobacteria bacterium]